MSRKGHSHSHSHSHSHDHDHETRDQDPADRPSGEEAAAESGAAADEARSPSGQGNDPGRVISEALNRASEAMGMDRQDSQDWTPETDGGEYGAVGRIVYRTSYGLSYGVVYPVALLSRMIPKENALVHGLTDGALAARDAVFPRAHELGEPSDAEAEAPAETASATPAPQLA